MEKMGSFLLCYDIMFKVNIIFCFKVNIIFCIFAANQNQKTIKNSFKIRLLLNF